MPSQPEAKLSKKIRLALGREVGGLWTKVHGGPFQSAGLPDIIGCVQGRFVGIEVKRPGREHTLAPLQRSTLDAIQSEGGIAFMSTSVEESVALVKSALNVKQGKKSKG